MPYSLTVHIDWPRRGNGERVRHGSFSPTRTSKFICHDTIDPTARQSIMNPATIPKSSMSHRFSSRVAIGQLSQWDLDPRVLGPSLHQAGRPSPRRLIRPGPNFLAVPRPAWRRASSRDVSPAKPRAPTAVQRPGRSIPIAESEVAAGIGLFAPSHCVTRNLGAWA